MQIDLAKHFLKRSFDPLFSIFIFLLVLLPSGSMFGINVKMICFFFLILPALYRFSKQNSNPFQIAALFIVPAIFLFWVLLSQIYWYEISFAFQQYKDLMIVIVASWFTLIFCSGLDVRRIQFLKLVLSAEMCACLIKIALLSYSFFRGIAVTDLVSVIHDIFGVQLMTFDIGDFFGRLQFISDGLIPQCMFILITRRTLLKISNFKASLMFALLTASLILAFSRYLWAYGVLAILLGVAIGKRDRFKIYLIGLLSIALVSSLPFLSKIYSVRTSTDIESASDSVRIDQVRGLNAWFWEAPMFGHGFGSYTPRIIRDQEQPYAYEVQLLALAGQIGIVGISLLSLMGVLYFRDIWRLKGVSFSHQMSVFIILMAWVGAGLFNPLLINSAAAVSYSALMVLGSFRNT